MQDSSPEGSPERQKTVTKLKVGAGFVDPCIVYLETTLPGEIPLLLACWARSSAEIQKPGIKTKLKLAEVVILEWRPGKNWLNRNVNRKWSLVTSQAKSLLVTANGKRFVVRAPSGHPLFTELKKSDFQGQFRHLDARSDASLQAGFDLINARHHFSRHVLELAPVEWPSVTNVLASLAARKTRKQPARKSIVRRMVSSIFKKTKTLPA